MSDDPILAALDAMRPLLVMAYELGIDVGSKRAEQPDEDECPVCHDTYTDRLGVIEHLASMRKDCGRLFIAASLEAS